MKNIGKLAILGAVLAASSPFALADNIGLFSYGPAGSPSSAGFTSINTALTYGGVILNPTTTWLNNPGTTGYTGGGATVVDLSTIGGSLPPWTAAGANSYWTSQNANTAPGGTPPAPNGYYSFTTTFSDAGGVYNLALNLLADDTVAVYLNGTNIQLAANPNNGDSKCTADQPNCITPLLLADNGVSLGSGSQTLTFIVEQTGLASMGLDFYGNIQSVASTPTPEPNSLILLGTGLIGAAGMMMFRRRRLTA